MTLIDRFTGEGTGLFGGAERAAADLAVRRWGVTDELVSFAVAVAVWAHRNGHACVELAGLGELMRRAAERAGEPGPVPALPDPAVLADALRSAPAVVRVVDAGQPGSVADAAADLRPVVLWGDRLYSQRQFVDELSVAASVGALAAGDRDVSTPTAVGFIDASLAVTDGDDAQNLAARAVLSRSFNVLVGGPGTGKTYTLVRSLLAYLLAAHDAGEPVQVAVCAPTGKAATRAGELLAAVADDPGVSGLPAGVVDQLGAIVPTTIHRLLGYRAGQRTRFAHDAARPLPHDLVVVDETSMVPLQLMARLLEAVRPDARVLLVGDDAQLESVESGSVLRDLAANPVALHGRVHALRRVRRVSGANPLAELAPLVRAGDADAALAVLRAGHPQVGFVEVPAGRSVDIDRLGGVVDRYAEVCALAHRPDPADHAAALGLFAGVRVLCGVRRGPVGVEAVNDAIDGRLGLRRDDPLAVGRCVLVTVNSPQVGLVNGDVAVAVRTGSSVAFAVADGDGVRYLAPAEMPPYERAYAMTVHKSQGSEYGGQVAVVLPSPGSPLLTRELVYTAITRAKQELTVVGAPEAFTAALANPSVRSSGLGGLLDLGVVAGPHPAGAPPGR